MPAEPKASASLAAEMGSSPVKLRYLDSVNLIERLHRRLLEVIKDDFERHGEPGINPVQALLPGIQSQTIITDTHKETVMTVPEKKE